MKTTMSAENAFPSPENNTKTHQTYNTDGAAVLRSGLLDSQEITRLRDTCRLNQPFPHVVVEDAIDTSLLLEVRHEIIRHLQLKYDSNHVYSLHRSTDLANISNPDESLPELFPHLIQLRDELYSARFRGWVSAITGVGPLSGSRSSMAINLYKPGDHLLTHDDCNPKSRDRRVSYILYITDPENPWQLAWGGGLRLYASHDVRNMHGDRVDLTLPLWSKCINPCFNQLVFFPVKPGQTYHEVQEVRYSGDVKVVADRLRIAVSGWLHAAQAGDEAFDQVQYESEARIVDHFHQIKADSRPFYEPQVNFTPFECSLPAEPGLEQELSPQDVNFLSRYMDSQWLDSGQIRTLSQPFTQTAVIQVDSFLCAEFAESLRDEIITLRRSHDNDQGSMTPGWRTARPPEAHRYLYWRYTAGLHDQSIPSLRLLVIFLQSHQYKKWLALATGFPLSMIGAQDAIVRNFRRGLDYVLTDTCPQKQALLEYTLALTPDQDMHGCVASATRDGGEEVFHSTDHDAVQSLFAGLHLVQAQRAQEDCKVSLSWNTLSIILRSQGMQSFVKFLSHAARTDRWDAKGHVQLTCSSTQDG